MLTVGDRFPDFSLHAAVSLKAGAEFGRRAADFRDRDAEILGFSTDSHFVHLAWRQSHPDLKDLPYPMLADIKRELSASLGILHREAGVALRATFLVDPQGVIRWACVNPAAPASDGVSRSRRRWPVATRGWRGRSRWRRPRTSSLRSSPPFSTTLVRPRASWR